MLKKIFKIAISTLVISTSAWYSAKYAVWHHWHSKQSIPKQIDTDATYHFAVFRKKGWGEHEFTKRIKKTAEKLGWQCLICSNHLTFWEKLFLNDPIQKTLTKFRPDFTVTLEGEYLFKDSGLNYKALSSSVEKYFNDRDPTYNADFLLKFDALLPSSNLERLQNWFEDHDKSFNGFLWYPTAPATAFKPLAYTKIFYCGINWDNVRGGDKYHTLFEKLDKKGYFEVYGPKNKWGHLTHSYRGVLPFDGESVICAAQNAGVTLVLHSKVHLEEGPPTARIFEAAAASSMIISDRHPFILKEFGDCVLFIDTTLDADAIMAQIDDHMQWIEQHPLEVAAMAKKAHSLFCEKYCLEKQLGHLEQMHRHVISHEKETPSLTLL